MVESVCPSHFSPTFNEYIAKVNTMTFFYTQCGNEFISYLKSNSVFFLVCFSKYGRFTEMIFHQNLNFKMDSEDEVEFSDYEIEDLFKSNIQETKGWKEESNLKNEALDESLILLICLLTS